MTGKRRWKPLRVPPSWIKPGARAQWHFIMSYYDGRAATILDAPTQTAAGDWLVTIRLDEDGRHVRAPIEALDPLHA